MAPSLGLLHAFLEHLVNRTTTTFAVDTSQGLTDVPSRGLINASAAFQTYYELYLLRQLESTTIAWIGSIQSWLLLCVGVVSGPLFDAGYGRQLLCAGSCLVPFGFMMTSVARNFWQLLLGQAFCIGIGGGLLFIPSIAIIPQYFTSRRRALAIGIAGLGSATSGTLVPLLFRELSAVVGFRWTARVLGFISLGTLAIALSVLRVKTLPSKRRSLTQFSAFRELPFIVLTLSNLITFTGCYAAVFYVQPFSVDRGITSAGLAFYLVPVLNAATIVGRIVLTFSADNLGPVNVLVIAQLINSIIAYSWIAVDSPAGVFTVASLYGFFMGGVVNLPFVTLVAVCPDLSDIGTRMGMCFFVASFGLLAGTPLAGKIQTEGSYRSLQVFAGSLLLAAALFTGILRVMKAGWTLKAKV